MRRVFYKFLNAKYIINLLGSFQQDSAVDLSKATKDNNNQLVIPLINYDGGDLENQVDEFFKSLYGLQTRGTSVSVRSKSFDCIFVPDEIKLQMITFDYDNSKIIISGDSLVAQFEQFIVPVLEQQHLRGSREKLVECLDEVTRLPKVLAAIIADYGRDSKESIKPKLAKTIQNYRESISFFNRHGAQRAKELERMIFLSDEETAKRKLILFFRTGQTECDYGGFSFLHSWSCSSGFGETSLRGRLIDAFVEKENDETRDERIARVLQHPHRIKFKF